MKPCVVPGAWCGWIATSMGYTMTPGGTALRWPSGPDNPRPEEL